MDKLVENCTIQKVLGAVVVGFKKNMIMLLKNIIANCCFKLFRLGQLLMNYVVTVTFALQIQYICEYCH